MGLSREELPIYRWKKIVSLFWWQDILHSVLYIWCWHVACGLAAFLSYFSYSFNPKWQYDKQLWIGMGEWDIPVRILQWTWISYAVWFFIAIVYGVLTRNKKTKFELLDPINPGYDD